MESFEKIKEVFEVFGSNIFYAKVINNEAELDEMPFVAPETRGGFHFIVVFSKEVRLEEIVGQDASLGKAIAALANFEVDPTVTVSVPASLYSSMNSAGMSEILMQTYSESGIGMSR
jgi:hypothetical protein